MNKHDLINELWDEHQSESLEEILADESQDKRVKNERIKNERVDESWEEIQADDLNEKKETFWMSVRRESQADE